jgi:hypothetical protein
MISYYELLGMIKEDKAPNKIKVHLTPCTSKIYVRENDLDDTFSYYGLGEEAEDSDYHYYLAECFLESMMFDETIEILEEEKELHANKIVFNCDNSKRECVINLDENDLGIDKLHIDNCYFYKENDKWYVRKYDFKTFNLEEKKIPEKLNLDIDELKGKETPRAIDYLIESKINQVIDYLKNKGE